MDLRRSMPWPRPGYLGEIARESGHYWRIIKRYLATDASHTAGAGQAGSGPRKIDMYAHLIYAWLRRQPDLKGLGIHERLVTEHVTAPWLAHPVEFEKLY
jgi:hypothetical protein